MKNIFSGLIAGVVMTTVMNQPSLANSTYSRAKTCYQNQYVETYHPGTRDKPGYVSSREVRAERPCPKTLHFHGGKSHKHQQGHRAHNHPDHPPTTSSGKTVVKAPAAEDNNSCLEGSLAGGVRFVAVDEDYLKLASDWMITCEQEIDRLVGSPACQVLVFPYQFSLSPCAPLRVAWPAIFHANRSLERDHLIDLSRRKRRRKRSLPYVYSLS